jgi:lipopolysaccharide export system permease protein
LAANLKTLHRYLLKQVIASLVMTLIVFTFVLLVGNALHEILPLLITGQASFGLIAKAFGLLIPFVLGFALPMALLTAVLLVFGRFSADQELTAARASGVSLLSLIAPILVLSLLLCGVSAWMNLEIAPRCRVAYNDLRFTIKAALANVKLPEGRFINFPGKPAYIFYAGKNHKQNLTDVLLYQFDDGTNLSMTVHAPRGMVSSDSTNHDLILNLFDAKGMMLPGGQIGSLGEMTVRMDLSASDKANKEPGISDMTFTQLLDKLSDLKNRINLPLEKTSPEPKGKKKRIKKPTDITEPIRVQIHRQVAFSLACFGFTLVGIPLGIRVHRRETNIGVAIALALVFIYYMFLIIGQTMTEHPELAPHLWMWLPNFIFQGAGAVLLWRANRGI